MGDDRIIYWPSLCGNRSENDAFWNWYLTMNSSTPAVTSCFQKTVLVWVPCGFLWLVAPFFAALLFRRPVCHPWTGVSKQNTMTAVLCVFCTLLSLAVLIIKLTNDNTSTTPVDIIAPSVQIVTFILVTVFTRWQFRKGLHTSGILFLFWLITLVCDIVILISKMTLGDTTPKDVFAVQCCEFVLVVMLFLLSCVADIEAIPADELELELEHNKWLKYNGGKDGEQDEKTPLLLGNHHAAVPEDDGVPSKASSNPCPLTMASILSEAFFFWFTPTVIKGVKSPLTKSDIWDITEEMSAEFNHRNLVREWEKELDKLGDQHSPLTDSDREHKRRPANVKHSRPSFTWAVARTFGPYFMLGAVFMCIFIVFNLLSPQLLQAIIAFMESEDPFIWKGYILATLFFLVTLFKTMAVEHQQDVAQLTAMRIRSALMGAIYRKAMKLSSGARRTTSPGAIVNLMAVDIERLRPVLLQLHYLWASPVLVIFSIVLLWQQIGWASLVGFAVLLILLPVNSLIVMRKIKELQRKQMKLKDTRLKLTGQILSGIKVLKLYAWELYFAKKLEDVRQQELKTLRKRLLYSVIMNAMFSSAPAMMSLACFATYTLTSPDHVLNAQNTFVSIALVNMLSMPLSTLSRVGVVLAQAVVSMKRVEDFLLKEEVEEPPAPDVSEKIKELDVNVVDGTFSWERDEAPCLKDINLKVTKGQLIAVVGNVGCGKSALLSALLGEMVGLGRQPELNGSVAYVAQQAWIQNLTVRENIIFTTEMDMPRYNRVMDACCLRQDMDILPAADLTEIGEKGINLSGGQKQRVSLARAVYNDADIYLLDDPLSAVDANVGRHLFEEVIGPAGFLAEKTRILVTHNISYLPQVDTIVVMKNGQVTETGSYEELQKNDGAFAEFLRNFANNENNANEDGNGNKDQGGRRKRLRAENGKPGLPKRGNASRLIEEETVETGFVKPAVIGYLLRAATWVWPSALLLAIVAFVVIQCSNQLWLSDWSSSGSTVNGSSDSKSLGLRLGVYGGLSLLQVAATACVPASVAMGAVTVGLVVHANICRSVMRSPMLFFETTPIGRILNRFSRDIDIIDQRMVMNVAMLTNNISALLATLVLVLYTVPIVAAVIVAVLIIFVILQRTYVICVCQLKRIDATRRSPLYALLGETIAGAQTIRAYQLQDKFTARMEELLNESQSVFFEVTEAGRWLGMSIQTIGNLITFATAMFGVVQTSVTPSSMGMALSFAMQLSQNLANVVRTTCELESQMVSVERIKEYSELPSEAPWETPENDPPDDWPSAGCIEYHDFQTRYRPDLGLVLHGIDCQIKPKEKVGLVGRTGAGKSSFAMALFRILEATNGFITIDQVNTSDLGLHTVRGRMSIIPQDPVLFSGTLRSNLDPAEKYTDEELWNALAHAHLKSFVNSLPQKLDHQCDDDGTNLSVGQRQLVCLARALLRKSQILVLDEATAAVDMETDELIQSTIRKEFKSCTIITIAHRLNTVMDYDRVMVLDEGRIREFDSPASLLKDSSSVFYAMAQDAKLV